MKKSILKFAAVLALCSPLASQAYVIKNNTEHLVHVRDRAGLRGISVDIGRQGSTACNPTSPGCGGKIKFVVSGYDANKKKVDGCEFTTKIDHENEHIFVIRHGTANIKYPNPGWCDMVQQS